MISALLFSLALQAAPNAADSTSVPVDLGAVVDVRVGPSSWATIVGRPVLMGVTASADLLAFHAFAARVQLGGFVDALSLGALVRRAELAIVPCWSPELGAWRFSLGAGVMTGMAHAQVPDGSLTWFDVGALATAGARWFLAPPFALSAAIEVPAGAGIDPRTGRRFPTWYPRVIVGLAAEVL